MRVLQANVQVQNAVTLGRDGAEQQQRGLRQLRHPGGPGHRPLGARCWGCSAAGAPHILL